MRLPKHPFWTKVVVGLTVLFVGWLCSQLWPAITAISLQVGKFLSQDLSIALWMLIVAVAVALVFGLLIPVAVRRARGKEFVPVFTEPDELQLLILKVLAHADGKEIRVTGQMADFPRPAQNHRAMKILTDVVALKKTPQLRREHALASLECSGLVRACPGYRAGSQLTPRGTELVIERGFVAPAPGTASS